MGTRETDAPPTKSSTKGTANEPRDGRRRTARASTRAGKSTQQPRYRRPTRHPLLPRPRGRGIKSSKQTDENLEEGAERKEKRKKGKKAPAAYHLSPIAAPDAIKASRRAGTTHHTASRRLIAHTHQSTRAIRTKKTTKRHTLPSTIPDIAPPTVSK